MKTLGKVWRVFSVTTITFIELVSTKLEQEFKITVQAFPIELDLFTKIVRKNPNTTFD